MNTDKTNGNDFMADKARQKSVLGAFFPSICVYLCLLAGRQVHLWFNIGFVEANG
jgi:hypothetical protein